MYRFQDVGVLLIARQLKMRVTEVQISVEQRISAISKVFDSWCIVLI